MMHDIQLDIATANSCNAIKWRNVRTTWIELTNTLAITTRTAETIKQYHSYTKTHQDKIKDVGGFVGGYLIDGRRLKASVKYRQVVALDIDYGTMDTWLDFVNLNAAGCVYSTHKHEPDNPRLRIVFPLDRQVNPDEYEAIARVVASWLDIEVFDPTTYQPSRLMYYPSTSKDGEFVYDRQNAPILCADDVLDELPDWTDPTTWPASSREKETRRIHTGSKVEDPEEKHGIVGAFCRSYGISMAIAEFLPEVYVPVDEMGTGRYTFIGGSTSGGLVVYDDKLAYSHHGTDPAGQVQCNAFDLVRLHKFGDLDEKAKEGIDIIKMPSYKAMAEFAGKLPAVKREIVRSRRADQANEYDDIEARARVIGRQDDWISQLETEGRGGVIKGTISNVVLILRNDANLKDAFAFNEFDKREVTMRALPWDRSTDKYPRALKDADDSQLRLYMERCYGITNKGNISDGLIVSTHDNTYHPVRAYLDACIWDGVERLDTIFIDLFGAEDTPYTRAVTRKSWVAAVARIYNPGCKYDQVTVLVGKQGTGKSTTLDAMGGMWFSDSVTNVEGKEALEGVQGAWILELAELAGVRRAGTDAVKHFVGKKVDRFRVAFGKRVEEFPRSCVFWGTINEADFLRDLTGNRRFWIINFLNGNAPTLSVWEDFTPTMVAQIWAEAKEQLARGENFAMLPEELEKIAKSIQDEHIEKDDRTGIVMDYLYRALPTNWDSLDTYQRRDWLRDETNVGSVVRKRVCILEIWSECLGKNVSDIIPRDSYALGKIMKTIQGWEPGASCRFKIYGVQKPYVCMIAPEDRPRSMRRK